MKSGNIFWGIFLIVIGILFGLKNFGIIDFYWSNVFRLWPFLLIYWGVTLLPVKQGTKILLTLFTVAGFFAALIFLPHKPLWNKTFHVNSNYRFNGYRSQSDYDSDEGDLFYFTHPFVQDVKRGIVKMDFAAGELIVKDTTSELVEFQATQIKGMYKASSEIDGDNVAVVKIVQDDVNVRGDDMDMQGELKLNPSVVWKLDVDAGAAKVDMDLKKFRISDLTLDAGATDIMVRLGSLEDRVNLDIDAGVSNLEIVIPESMAAQIKSNTLVASVDFQGFTSMGNGLYQTPDFETNPKKVFVNIDAAAAAVTVRRQAD